jgi:hypothetical protein
VPEVLPSFEGKNLRSLSATVLELSELKGVSNLLTRFDKSIKPTNATGPLLF